MDSLVDDRKVKIVTFVLKFGCQGSINVMFEVKVKVGSRFRRICCMCDYEFHWIYYRRGSRISDWEGVRGGPGNLFGVSKKVQKWKKI